MKSPASERAVRVCRKRQLKGTRLEKKQCAEATGQARRRRRDGQQVDLHALLIEPVLVAKGGKVQKMDPFEAMLRRQLELALKERSMAAMKIVLEHAIEYDLIKKPPPAESGGVLLVPMITEEEIAFVRSWSSNGSISSESEQK